MPTLLLVAMFVTASQGLDAAAVARAAAEDLAQGRHAEFLSRASPRLRAAMPELKLSQQVRQFFGTPGAFEAVEGSPSCGPVRDMTYCVVVLRFAERRVSLRLSVNGAGQIGGMGIVGNDLRTERVASPLKIDAGRWSLPAFLALPDGPSGPAEYEVPGHIPQEVIDDIASWIRAH